MKPEKDFTKDADKLIPEAEALAKVREKIIRSLGAGRNCTDDFLPDRCSGCDR
jgi:hypothetical protein